MVTPCQCRLRKQPNRPRYFSAQKGLRHKGRQLITQRGRNHYCRLVGRLATLRDEAAKRSSKVLDAIAMAEQQEACVQLCTTPTASTPSSITHVDFSFCGFANLCQDVSHFSDGRASELEYEISSLAFKFATCP